MAARLDQSGRKTVSTNRMFVGVPVHLIWYVAVGWWMLGHFAAWFAWTWLMAAPFCGVIAVHYWRGAGRSARLLWHQLRATVRRGTLERLRQRESELRARLEELAGEYVRRLAG